MHKPERDYYRDLGISQAAAQSHIKKAYYRLAKIHHPDKKAPGQTVDAAEFRQIHEAYEFLSDAHGRARYDCRYFILQDDWTRYREWEAGRSRAEELRRAEEAARKRRAADAEKLAKMVGKRQAAEAERFERENEARRVRLEEARLKRLRVEKERLAERRSLEAARRALERQEEAAKQRLREQEIRAQVEAELARELTRQQKAKEAARRSEQAILKMRMEQKLAAQERLKMHFITEKQDEVRSNWAQMREKARLKGECHGGPRANTGQHPNAPASPICVHPRFGWPRRKAAAPYSFCGAYRERWSFQCPDCKAAACPACKTKYCVL